MNNPDIKVEDGTLFINNIQKSSHGYYLCEAVNGIGSGLSAVIMISVQGNVPFSLKKIKNTFCFENMSNKSTLHQRPQLLTLNYAIKLQDVVSHLFYSAKLRVRNLLEFCGTKTISALTQPTTASTYRSVLSGDV